MRLSIAFSLAAVGAVYAQAGVESASVSDVASSVAPSAAAGSASASVADVVSASATGSASARTGTRAASASSTPSAGAGAGSGSAIPSGVSAECSAYLHKLNSDPEFATCTAPLISATSAFIPGAVNRSADSIVTTLNTLCAATGCAESYIRKQLIEFYAACKPEMGNGASANKAVKDTYDIIYIMVPMKKAMCSKDDGTYCVLKTPSQATNTAVTDAKDSNPLGVSQNFVDSTDAEKIHDAVAAFEAAGNVSPGGNSLRRRQATGGQTIVQNKPDTKVYRDNGVMYLFTMPSLSKDALCTTCTQQVLKAYAPWEASVPYGPGLSNSPMLGGQAELWKQIQAKCDASFLAPVKAAVGSNQYAANSGTNVVSRAGVWSVAVGLALGMAFGL